MIGLEGISTALGSNVLSLLTIKGLSIWNKNKQRVFFHYVFSLAKSEGERKKERERGGLYGKY